MANALASVALATWWILEDAAVFILAGFALAGIIKEWLPLRAVKQRLGGRRMKSVVTASLLGAPLPLCSCSVIPTAVTLRKQGAGKGAVSSFLISTPETGADSISVSYALLDPIFTLFRPVAAVITAFTAGALETFFGDDTQTESEAVGRSSDCCSTACGDDADHGRSGVTFDRLREGLQYAFVDLMDDLAGWMVVGLVSAGAIMALTPENFFIDLFDGSFLVMPAMLLLGVPMYICATSSTPMAAAMIMKGLSPGAALVFLLAGPATNIGSIMILRKFLGGRSLGIYLFSIAFCAIVLGVVLDALYVWLAIDPAVTIGQAADIMPAPLEFVAALVFTALAARSLVTRYLIKKQATAGDDLTVTTRDEA